MKENEEQLDYSQLENTISLRSLNLKTEYNTEDDNIIVDFYSKCLLNSSRYDRAVGFFTSNGLSAAARGIASLIRNGGRMRLVASPLLSEEDSREIEKGYEQRSNEIIERLILDVVDNLPSGLIEARVKSLAWLISVGRLDIKLAYSTQKPGFGIYHLT